MLTAEQFFSFESVWQINAENIFHTKHFLDAKISCPQRLNCIFMGVWIIVWSLSLGNWNLGNKRNWTFNTLLTGYCLHNVNKSCCLIINLGHKDWNECLKISFKQSSQGISKHSCIVSKRPEISEWRSVREDPRFFSLCKQRWFV